MEIQSIQNRYLTLDEVLLETQDPSTEVLEDIEDTYQSYLEELNQEIKTTDKLWLEFQAGQCVQFGHSSKSLLYRIINSSIGYPENAIAAANAITILKVMGVSLSRLDFCGVQIPYADLSEALLQGANFQGAVLRGVNFTDAVLGSVDFDFADLKEIEVGKLPPLEHISNVKNWVITPDQRYLISIDKENIYTWNLTNGALEKKVSAKILSDDAYSMSYLQNYIILQSNTLFDKRLFIYKYTLDSSDESEHQVTCVNLAEKSSEHLDSVLLSPDGTCLLLCYFNYTPKKIVKIRKYSIKNINDVSPKIFEQNPEEYVFPEYFFIQDVKFSPRNSLLAITHQTEETVYIFDLTTGKFGKILDPQFKTIQPKDIVFTEDEKQLIFSIENRLYISDLWDESVKQWNVENIKRSFICTDGRNYNKITDLQFFSKKQFLLYLNDQASSEIVVRDIAKNKKIACYSSSTMSNRTSGVCSFDIKGVLYIGEIKSKKISFIKFNQSTSDNTVTKRLTTYERVHAIAERLSSFNGTQQPSSVGVQLPIAIFGHTIDIHLFPEKDDVLANKIAIYEKLQNINKIWHSINPLAFNQHTYKSLFPEKIASNGSTNAFQRNFVMQENRAQLGLNMDVQWKVITEKVELVNRVSDSLKKYIYYDFKILLSGLSDSEVLHVHEPLQSYFIYSSKKNRSYVVIFTLQNKLKIFQQNNSIFSEIFSFDVFDASKYDPTCAYNLVLSDNFSLSNGYIALAANHTITVLRIFQVNDVPMREILFSQDVQFNHFELFFKHDKLLILHNKGYFSINLHTHENGRLSEKKEIFNLNYSTDNVCTYTFSLSRLHSLVAFTCQKTERKKLLEPSEIHIVLFDLDSEKIADRIKTRELDLHIFFDESYSNKVLLRATSILGQIIKEWEVINRKVLRLVHQIPVKLETDCSVENALNLEDSIKRLFF